MMGQKGGIPTRAAWNREQLQRIDLRWHDLRHEGACRLLADAVDIRIIQLMLGHGIEPTRTRAHGRVNREHLAEIDLHWHDLRHEAACRWLAKGLDLRA